MTAVFVGDAAIVGELAQDIVNQAGRENRVSIDSACRAIPSEAHLDDQCSVKF